MEVGAGLGLPIIGKLLLGQPNREPHRYCDDREDSSAEATYSGKYPIARYLYIYFNKKPNEQIDPLRGEFINYVLSRDGQALVEKGGFYPISKELRQLELKRLGLSSPAE
jgi:hypothetical protein